MRERETTYVGKSNEGIGPAKDPSRGSRGLDALYEVIGNLNRTGLSGF